MNLEHGTTLESVRFVAAVSVIAAIALTVGLVGAAASAQSDRTAATRTPRATRGDRGANVVATANARPISIESGEAVDEGDPGASISARRRAHNVSGVINVNTATEQQLDQLPLVGPTRARAIIETRARLGGRFRRHEDLLRVRGIGRSTLRELRELIVLDGATTLATTTGARTGVMSAP